MCSQHYKLQCTCKSTFFSALILGQGCQLFLSWTMDISMFSYHKHCHWILFCSTEYKYDWKCVTQNKKNNKLQKTNKLSSCKNQHVPLVVNKIQIQKVHNLHKSIVSCGYHTPFNIFFLQNTNVEGAKEITMMVMMRKHIRVLVEGAEYSKSGSRNSWLVANMVINWWLWRSLLVISLK